MCQNCAVLSQVNYSCGHQLLLVKNFAKFCLFYPHKDTEFHMAAIAYSNYPTDYPCKSCALSQEAAEKGIHKGQRKVFIAERYPKSKEASSIEDAKWYLATAKKSQEGVDASKIEELNKRAKEQIKYYLGREGKKALTRNDKAILLKTILQVPAVIDRHALVVTFGSFVGWNQKQNHMKFIHYSEMSVLRDIARKGGMLKALETGLAQRGCDA
ncbi:hypothetical protein F5Y00DRAFT_259748 [Daldinia vernicosa]|uniref:uncharacterized protein n=1 Tax=Daldinia vernicosa TaxID=114800 RepID=UPI0020083DC9|nr:uncharacterized protein F5Y00DRAFT_259748 [Daldinia vernicosa]KAI0851211.1 hypothetical protein F5Y00DRAFT_259748 [Daldinia vernicosa]